MTRATPNDLQRFLLPGILAGPVCVVLILAHEQEHDGFRAGMFQSGGDRVRPMGSPVGCEDFGSTPQSRASERESLIPVSTLVKACSVDVTEAP